MFEDEFDNNFENDTGFGQEPLNNDDFPPPAEDDFQPPPADDLPPPPEDNLPPLPIDDSDIPDSDFADGPDGEFPDGPDGEFPDGPDGEFPDGPDGPMPPFGHIPQDTQDFFEGNPDLELDNTVDFLQGNLDKPQDLLNFIQNNNLGFDLIADLFDGIEEEDVYGFFNGNGLDVGEFPGGPDGEFPDGPDGEFPDGPDGEFPDGPDGPLPPFGHIPQDTQDFFNENPDLDLGNTVDFLQGNLDKPQDLFDFIQNNNLSLDQIADLFDGIEEDDVFGYFNDNGLDVGEFPGGPDGEFPDGPDGPLPPFGHIPQDTQDFFNNNPDLDLGNTVDYLQGNLDKPQDLFDFIQENNLSFDQIADLFDGIGEDDVEDFFDGAGILPPPGDGEPPVPGDDNGELPPLPEPDDDPIEEPEIVGTAPDSGQDIIA